MGIDATFHASALSDGQDRLVNAEEPLAGLQLRCGGDMPGRIAIPALLDLVRRARQMGLRLAQPVQALDGEERVTTWVEVTPRGDAEQGCDIVATNWHAVTLPAESDEIQATRKMAIDRHLAEITARLDSDQAILMAHGGGTGADAQGALKAMQSGVGRPWTECVELPGNTHRQPMHWRLLDGAKVRLAGSERNWTARLVPLGAPMPGSAGFELFLVPDEALVIPRPVEKTPPVVEIGREIAPVLRQPIARIIANAETIRARLAGPLADEYSDYAADIASAGQHLLSLIEDMADMEVVESTDFSTAPDLIDLSDVARRAAGILGMRARERNITISAPQAGETLPATAEFRRVLQILLNLIGNALRYAPEGSEVWIRLEDGLGAEDGKTENEATARIIIADQGPGLSEADQSRIFEKFERLGRSGDGGTGLGLYISRRLARAMGGDLTVESAPGHGARFILELPAG